MKKLFALSFILLSFVALQTACIKKQSNEQQAQSILEKAVFFPEQAFPKFKTFYMKKETSAEMPSLSEAFLDSSGGEMAADFKKIMENTSVQEVYMAGNKFRIGLSMQTPLFPVEVILMFDGKNLWTISNFMEKYKEPLSPEQAKAVTNIINSASLDKIGEMFNAVRKELIVYKYNGIQIVNGQKCHVVEASLKGQNDIKMTFYVDKKTKVVMKIEQNAFLPSVTEVTKVEKIKDKYVPVTIKTSSGDMFTSTAKYSLRINELMLPEVFEESDIYMPVRAIFQSEEFPETAKKEMINMVKSMVGFAQDLNSLMTETDTAKDGEKDKEPAAAVEDKADFAAEMKELKELQDSLDKSLEELQTVSRNIEDEIKKFNEEMKQQYDKMSDEEREKMLAEMKKAYGNYIKSLNKSEQSKDNAKIGEIKTSAPEPVKKRPVSDVPVKAQPKAEQQTQTGEANKEPAGQEEVKQTPSPDVQKQIPVKEAEPVEEENNPVALQQPKENVSEQSVKTKAGSNAPAVIKMESKKPEPPAEEIVAVPEVSAAENGEQASKEESDGRFSEYYKNLEDELEELKKDDYDEYVRMKKIVDDMKKQNR